MSKPPRLEEILKKLKSLKPYLHDKWGVTELAVFGSVARGEATPESDIDIMFDYDRPMGWEIVSLGDFLEAEFGCKVDLLTKPAIRPQVWQFIHEEMRYV